MTVALGHSINFDEAKKAVDAGASVWYAYNGMH